MAITNRPCKPPLSTAASSVRQSTPAEVQLAVLAWSWATPPGVMCGATHLNPVSDRRQMPPHQLTLAVAPGSRSARRPSGKLKN